MAAKPNKVYEVVTDRIMEALEQGIVPWRKPWTTKGVAHANLATGNG